MNLTKNKIETVITTKEMDMIFLLLSSNTKFHVMLLRVNLIFKWTELLCLSYAPLTNILYPMKLFYLYWWVCILHEIFAFVLYICLLTCSQTNRPHVRTSRIMQIYIHSKNETENLSLSYKHNICWMETSQRIILQTNIPFDAISSW